MASIPLRRNEDGLGRRLRLEDDMRKAGKLPRVPKRRCVEAATLRFHTPKVVPALKGKGAAYSRKGRAERRLGRDGWASDRVGSRTSPTRAQIHHFELGPSPEPVHRDQGAVPGFAQILRQPQGPGLARLGRAVDRSVALGEAVGVGDVEDQGIGEDGGCATQHA